MNVNNDLAARLARTLPQDAVDASEATRIAYATDSSRRSFLPDVVVWPASEGEVAAVLGVANGLGVPVYARGRGTATTGSSLAELGGVMLSTERMAAIGAVDVASRCVTAQPGVLNGDLAEALLEHGMHWPPDPSSAPYSSLGGNLATAAAGPRGVKYGGVRENILAVRAVCGDGAIVHAGAKVPKSSVGYDLARLLVGSEGKLAVITEATLRIQPVPAFRARALAQYRSSGDALAAVTRLLSSATTPSAAEFIDEAGVKLLGRKEMGLEDSTGALLMLEADGLHNAGVQAEMGAMEKLAAGDGMLAFAKEEGEGTLWRARKVLSQKLRGLGMFKLNEDVVVPVQRQAELVEKTHKACAAAKLECVVFGHAGVGNLHVNIMYDDPGDHGAGEAAAQGLMELAIELGGSISGEHGVGIAKRHFVDLQLEPATREFFVRLKSAFDPNNILNPEPDA